MGCEKKQLKELNYVEKLSLNMYLVVRIYSQKIRYTTRLTFAQTRGAMSSTKLYNPNVGFLPKNSGDNNDGQDNG